MGRMRKKADLPAKTCPVCHRPFTWRKKWEKVWDEVKYCSDRCRREAKNSGRPRGDSGLSPRGQGVRSGH
ncbi:MAG: DUF2256 domain-containing protein [Pseudomonadota bacterium]